MNLRMLFAGVFAFALVSSLVVGSSTLVAAEARAADLSLVDLSGDWYVILHYKDDRSEDASLVKFKDFAWSLRQDGEEIKLVSYPYVMFHEELEMVRKEAMRRHRGWEPSPGLEASIRRSLNVSPRARAKKTLTGSRAEGFSSAGDGMGGGLNTVTFTRDWRISFAPEKVRFVVTDSLSGGMGLEGMEDSTVYELTEKVSDDEFRGTYAEPHKKGTLRMIRTKQVQVKE